MSNAIVLVTGASGFIATHVIQQLQRAGYRVRGTVRSLANEEKVKPLKNLCPDAKHGLELFEADLTSDAGWEQAVRGCDCVMHTASPFPNAIPAHESELIIPAVEGTTRVLEACRKVGVKKVVLTSSTAAVVTGNETVAELNESHWTDIEKTSNAYFKSKTLAEKAAWDFVNKLGDAETIDLVVMNPCFVLGPVLCGGWATSMELTKRLLERQIPAIPKTSMSMVDVRDVAAAHIAGMMQPEAVGKRHILCCRPMWFSDVAEIYRKEFAPLGYNVPTRTAPWLLVKILSFFDKTVGMVLPNWGVVTKLDNTRMKEVLKIQPRPIEETLIDMAYSMIEKGFIKKTEKYIEVKE